MNIIIIVWCILGCFRRLLTQLESFKPGQKATAGGKDAPSGGDHVKYELFYRPEQAQFSRNAKVNY